MKTRVLLKIILGISSLLFLSCTGGQRANVHINTVSGQAHIYQDHTDSARETAINNALHVLVLKSYREDENIKKYKLVQPFLNIRESGIVHNWKILRQKDDDGIIYVQVRGAVNRSLRDERVKKLMKTYTPDALLVVYKEGEKEHVDSSLSSVFSEQLVSSDMGIINANDLLSANDKGAESILKEITGNNVASNRRSFLLTEAGAEIFIVASVAVSDQSEVLDDYDTHMKSMRAVVNIRSVDSYTGKILSSRSDTAAGAHVDINTASQMAIRNCILKSSILGKNGEGLFLQQTVSAYINLLSKREYSLICTDGDLQKLVDGLILSSDRIISAHAVDSGSVSAVFAGTMNDLKSLFGSNSYELLKGYTVESAGADSLTLKLQ